MVGTVFNTAGGLALFVLAMVMMTRGLKTLVGSGLRDALQRWTSNRFSSVAVGAGITGLVQSSSAVTVAAIGFVNAGILSMQQALGVVFGANLGTTVTSWLVASTGYGLPISALAMPMLAVGVALGVVSERKRLRALGDALTGFGLFFLGLSVLQAALSGAAGTLGGSWLMEAGIGGLAGFFLAGIAVTLMTQSSSATIALILMAASQSVIGLGPAAAAIIGADIGTASTGLLVSLGATPNARRLAVGQAGFNLITGLIALAILPGFLGLSHALGQVLGLSEAPATQLALFHSLFNLFGIAAMLPLIGRYSVLLGRLFPTDAEDISQPRYLDRNLVATPEIAVHALWQELGRMEAYAGAVALSGLTRGTASPRSVRQTSQAVFSLGEAITDFMTRVHMETLPREIAEELPGIIRTARYLEQVAQLAPSAAELSYLASRTRDADLRPTLDAVLQMARDAIVHFAKPDPDAAHHDRSVILIDHFQTAYQAAKLSALRSAAQAGLEPEDADTLLDALSATRRLIDQAGKADRILAGQMGVA